MDKVLSIYRVFGRKVRAHNAMCADGFREDRKHGLIYSSYNVEGTIMSVEQASLECDFCVYCGKK